MKKFFYSFFVSLLTIALPFSISAFEKDKDYVHVEEVSPENYVAFGENYPGSLNHGWPECTTGQLLKGTVIAYFKNGTHCTEDNNASYAFDGNPDTYFDNFSRESYAALILDQAYELTEIRIHPCNSMPGDTMFGMSIQGSNDGVHWVDIVLFNQDSHGKEYHIFTPQTVTDQRYIDAGYTAKKDESLFWRGTGAYSMYRYINQSSIYDSMIAEIELYGNPAEATELNSRILSEMRPTLTFYRGNINVRNVHTTSESGALTGTVIGAGGTWNKNFYENAFDGSNRTVYDPAVKGPECWAGLLLDEPAVITEVRVMPGRGDRLTRTEGAHIQGSTDGIHWTSLASFDAWDCVEEQAWIIKAVTDPTPYTYIRYVSSGIQHGDAAELLFFGYPATASEDQPPAETVPQTESPEITETKETLPTPPQTGESLPKPETQVGDISHPTESRETEYPQNNAPLTPLDTESPEIPPQTSPEHPSLSPESEKNIFAVGITAVVVIISAAGVFISKKRNKENDE